MRSRALCGLAVVLLAGCQQTKVSDTGYTGTWARGEPRSRSVLSIVRERERFWFRLARTSQNDKWKVTCDWEGACVEQVEGKTVASYTFRWWVDDASGHLMAEQKGKVTSPRPLDIHVIDEFVVQPGGLWLGAHSRLRHGQSYPLGAGPVVYFEKISDEVLDRPPGS